jgi:DNA-binding IclR family transcriptional regulator
VQHTGERQRARMRAGHLTGDAVMRFTEGSEHSLTEIAQLAGLLVSTAHRLTSELASWRLRERTEGGVYRAGLPLRMMSTGGRACAPTLQERAPRARGPAGRHRLPGPPRRAA